jgi:trimeric autotransporter adhesin
MTTILTKKKDTAGAPAAGDLTNAAGGAELAVNTATKRLYSKDSGGNVIEIGTNPSTIDTTTVDTTNLEVTNIKAKDGTASATIADSTGIFTHSTATVFTAGTAALPAITTTGDTNTGIFFSAADQVAISTGGTQRAVVNASGNVGIGTTSPSALLYVQSASTNALVINQVLRNPNGGTPVAAIGFNVATVGEGDYTQAGIGLTRSVANGSGSLCFYNKGSGTASNFTTADEKMRIDASGNVGIGTTSPSYKLDVIGQASRLGSGSTGSVFGITTNTGGSLLFGVDQSTGGSLAGGSSAYAGVLNHTGAYSLQFGTNNTVRATIDSSGNVGIGISSPAVKLDINGITAWQGGTTGQTAQIVGANSGVNGGSNLRVLSNTTQAADVGGSISLGGYYNGVAQSVDYAQIIGAKENSTSGNAAGYLTFGTRPAGGNMAERMRIDSSGNVGIGVTPTAALGALQVTTGTNGTAAKLGNGAFVQSFNGDAYYSGSASLDSAGVWTARSTGSSTIGATIASGLLFYTNTSLTNGNTFSPTERMRIDTSGNVGIGTSSLAGYRVSVKQSGNTSLASVGIASINSANDTYIGMGYNATSDTCRILASYDSTGAFKPITFLTSDAERMRINSSGALLVGNTGAYLWDAKILGYNTTSAHAAATLVTNYAGDVSQAAVVIGKADNNTSTSQQFVWFYVNATTPSGAIVANGASTATFAGRSDIRIKENIVDLPSQLTNIMGLRPVEYDFIESAGGGRQIGFIAQEVQEIYPDLVSSDKDGMLMLADMNKNDARLIKAIQEMKAIIDTQSSTIQSLTARITALESK